MSCNPVIVLHDAKKGNDAVKPGALKIKIISFVNKLQKIMKFISIYILLHYMTHLKLFAYTVERETSY